MQNTAAIDVARAFVAGFSEKLADADLEGREEVLEGVREYILAYTGRFPFMLALYRAASKNTLSLPQSRGAANVLRAEARPRKATASASRAGRGRTRFEDSEARAWRQMTEAREGDGSYAPTWEDAQDYFDR